MKRVQDLSEEEFAQLVRRAADLPDAPEALVRAATNLFSARASPTLAETARAVVNRVLAALAFDSWAPASALAVRGVPSETRQMLFSALGRDIDLRITPAPGNFSLTGQVLGPDRAGIIELTSDAGGETATALHTAQLDDLGEFRLHGLQAGRYTLLLRVADADIELPPIDIGAQRG
jgi:hypothetical protein